MVLLFVRSRALEAEGSGGVEQLIQDALSQRPQATLLRGRQLGRDHEVSQVHQGFADPFQAMFQPGGGG
jgi:hypothetical protein